MKKLYNCEKKYVGFIDLLGIKQIIKANNQTQLDKLKKLFINIKDDIVFQKKLRKKINRKGKCVISIFSDSLYFSYPKDYGLDLLEDISKIFIEALKMGFSFRGGITFGFIDDKTPNIIMGPAMIRAYEMESTLAVYPRILIDLPAFNDLKILDKQIAEKYCIKDTNDKAIFLNFLQPEFNLLGKGLSTIEKTLREIKNKCRKNDKNILKINWLIQYFNSQVDIINTDLEKKKNKSTIGNKIQLKKII